MVHPKQTSPGQGEIDKKKKNKIQKNKKKEIDNCFDFAELSIITKRA